MIKKFDKLFELFPNAKQFTISCDACGEYELGRNAKRVSVDYMNHDIKTAWIISGIVSVKYPNDKIKCEVLDVYNGDYYDAPISDDDARMVLAIATEAFYKTDTPTGEFFRLSKDDRYGKTHYLMQIPRIEYDYRYADNFKWYN